MPSFDVVSEVDKQELDNAVNQTIKEITQRYDFRASKSEVNLEKDLIKLLSDDEYKMKALQDVLLSKAIKRGLDSRVLDFGKVEDAAGGLAKCEVKIVEGISQELGKKINKAIKDSKLKVQSQIQGDQVRVTGKKRDDLQEVISFLKENDWEVPLQFKNFRD
ncbi:MAG: YajQ family cyclic di-GMP-binding protein [Deltaproteobacteria bacterium]|nr:YajQ family cyclic di-GMP-binding protein [Deltaproteobacteria bacterium]